MHDMPSGFEFVVSDVVPRGQGLRRLNARTFEAHPDTYAGLAYLFGHWDDACGAVHGLVEAVRAIGGAGHLSGDGIAAGDVPALFRVLAGREPSPKEVERVTRHLRDAGLLRS